MDIREAEIILREPVGTDFEAVKLCEKRREAKEVIIKAVEKGQSLIRKQGRWIEREDEGEFYWECSECGQRINWVDETDHYCCNCGTKMGAEA